MINVFLYWEWYLLRVSTWYTRLECDPSPEVFYSVRSICDSFKQNIPEVSHWVHLIRISTTQLSVLFPIQSFFFISYGYSFIIPFIIHQVNKCLGNAFFHQAQLCPMLITLEWRKGISLLLYFQTCKLETTDKEGCLWLYKCKSEELPFLSPPNITANALLLPCLLFFLFPSTQRPPLS